MGRDRIIEAYIQRLLTWEKPISRGILVAIAEEVGITSQELEAIYAEAQAHLTRGRSYIEFGCLNDGILELAQATSLDPVNLEMLHALANAYNLRYNREAAPADRQRALLVAKRCLELKPNDKEALVLISFLENNPAKNQQKVSRWTKQKIAMVASGLVTMGIGFAVVSRLPIFSRSTSSLGPAPGTLVPGSALYESGEPSSAAVAVSPGEGVDLSADVDIPVMFDHPGLVLEARLSELGDYEDDVYYQLQGVLINAGDQEVRKLDLNVEFLDGNNTAIATTSKAGISSDDAIIRPGDTHPFNLLQKTAPGLTAIRVSVTNLEQAPARTTYVPPTPINYSWGKLVPENISFELASRSEAVGVFQTAPSEPPDGDSPTPLENGSSNDADKKAIEQRQSRAANFNSEWVIINTSDFPIRELKLKADFYHANNQLLQTEDIVVIHNNDAPLLAGETRPFRVIKSVNNSYKRYRVTVLEFE